MNYEQIVEINNELISKVFNYIKLALKLKDEQIFESPRIAVRNALILIRKNNYDIATMRKKRDLLVEDFAYLERSGCKTASCDGIGEGHNTGGKPNNELNRNIQMLITKEDISKITTQILLAEKTRSDINQMLRDFIYTIPQPQYARIVEATYFELMNDDLISAEMDYSYDSIRIFRNKAIKELAAILKSYMQKNIMDVQ